MSKYKISIMLVTLTLLIGFIPKQAGATPEERFGGEDRYETATIISQVAWPRGAEQVVLARGDEFADALASTPFAADINGPILLTAGDSLTSKTATEIRRLGAQKVWVMGGESAISKRVISQLENIPGVEVERVAGEDRIETSVKIANKLSGTPQQAIVVNRDRFPDAIAIAPYAALKKVPIILSGKDSLNIVNSSFLENVEKTYVIGGEAVLSNALLKKTVNGERIAGENRYVTSVRIAEKFFPTANYPIIATGEQFADGLTGSMLAAKRNQPILLVKYNEVDDSVRRFFYFRDVSNYTVLGGYNAVHQYIYSQLVLGR